MKEDNEEPQSGMVTVIEWPSCSRSARISSAQLGGTLLLSDLEAREPKKSCQSNRSAASERADLIQRQGGQEASFQLCKSKSKEL